MYVAISSSCFIVYNEIDFPDSTTKLSCNNVRGIGCWKLEKGNNNSYKVRL